jgi:hypothetical protein
MWHVGSDACEDDALADRTTRDKPSHRGFDWVADGSDEQQVGAGDHAGKSFEYAEQAFVVLWRVHAAHVDHHDRILGDAKFCSNARTVGPNPKLRDIYSSIDDSTTRIVRPLGS